VKIVASLSLLVVIAFASAAGDPSGVAKKAIAADYKAISKAFADKDFKTLASFMTDDFKGYPPKGAAITKADVTKDFSQERDHLTDVKWDRTILKFNLDGTTAHVSVEGIMTGKLVAGNGKGHLFSIDAHSQDDWVKVGKDWKIRQTKAGSMDIKMDGKPITMRRQ
jgi:ketosteroid isomerase-like protein